MQPYGLLAQGRQILDELFPGFTEALVARGGLSGDIETEVAVDVVSGQARHNVDGYGFARINP